MMFPENDARDPEEATGENETKGMNDDFYDRIKAMAGAGARRSSKSNICYVAGYVYYGILAEA